MSITSSSTISTDTQSSEIKKFLTKSLIFTPRRYLFEEFNNNLLKIREQQTLNSRDEFVQVNLPDDDESLKFDCKFLNNLCEFRVKNASECMSEINYRRFKRMKDQNDDFLKHKCVHRFRLNDRLIPMPVKSNELGKSLCLLCNKPAEGSVHENSLIINESELENKQKSGFFVLEGSEIKRKTKIKSNYHENSFALTHQKLKY